MGHICSADARTLSNFSYAHPYLELIQKDARIEEILDRTWLAIKHYAAAEPYGLNNLIFRIESRLDGNPTLIAQFKKFTQLAEDVNWALTGHSWWSAHDDLGIGNRFCIEEYVSANKKLKQKFLDQSVTALWEQGVLPKLQEMGLPPERTSAKTPQQIRSYVSDQKNAPHLAKISFFQLYIRPFYTCPPEIGHFHSLKWISLSDVPLTNFSLDLSSLPQLEEIEVAHCSLFTDFRADLSPCVNFKKLFIQNCNLKSFSLPYPLPKTLTGLNLSGNSLERFDVDLTPCSDLRFLSLSSNRLTSFTTDLSSCHALWGLELNKNLLETFNPNLNGCPFLRHLDLHDNRLQEIAADCGPCTQLERLWLNENPLENYTPH